MFRLKVNKIGTVIFTHWKRDKTSSGGDIIILFNAFRVEVSEKQNVTSVFTHDPVNTKHLYNI